MRKDIPKKRLQDQVFFWEKLMYFVACEILFSLLWDLTFKKIVHKGKIMNT